MPLWTGSIPASAPCAWTRSVIRASAGMSSSFHSLPSAYGANLWSREAPMAAGHMPVTGIDPAQVRQMSTQDIADLRLWHRRAVSRSIEAGFDIVYVYASHGLNTIGQFLSPLYNFRTDGYGGSLENLSLIHISEPTRH